MDDAPAVNDDVIAWRRADFAAYRCGDLRPISLGTGCNVIPFRKPELPDMSNVVPFIARKKPDPTPPTTPTTPAMAMVA